MMDDELAQALRRNAVAIDVMIAQLGEFSSRLVQLQIEVEMLESLHIESLLATGMPRHAVDATLARLRKAHAVLAQSRLPRAPESGAQNPP
jgi:predicted Kef-type K+ transport protein